MLLAVVVLYKITHSVIGSAVISATVGVRQGSPTSCLLFIIVVNDFIRLIKQNWHGWLPDLVTFACTYE